MTPTKYYYKKTFVAVAKYYFLDLNLFGGITQENAYG